MNKLLFTTFFILSFISVPCYVHGDVAIQKDRRVEQVKISFLIQDVLYELKISENASVYDAMLKLAAATLKTKRPLEFKAKRYPGLGFFIREINSLRNAKGFYWTLYINGTYSVVGASQYRVKQGDVIEWRYEKK